MMMNESQIIALIDSLKLEKNVHSFSDKYVDIYCNFIQTVKNTQPNMYAKLSQYCDEVFDEVYDKFEK